MRFFRKAPRRGDETKQWIISSFDEPDLSYASRYYRAHMSGMDVYYRPYPAMIPCGTTEKPAIIVKIPEAARHAFGERVMIDKHHIEVLQCDMYAVLWIRAVAYDPGGLYIRAMVPGSTTITTQAAASALSTIPLDVFLDVADVEVQRWASAWCKGPDIVYFFVVETWPRIATYLHLSWAPDEAEKVLGPLREAQNLLVEIPSGRQDFKAAVQQFRTEINAF